MSQQEMRAILAGSAIRIARHLGLGDDPQQLDRLTSALLRISAAISGALMLPAERIRLSSKDGDAVIEVSSTSGASMSLNLTSLVVELSGPGDPNLLEIVRRGPRHELALTAWCVDSAELARQIKGTIEQLDAGQDPMQAILGSAEGSPGKGPGGSGKVEA